MKKKVIDRYYWHGYLGSYEVKGFVYDEDKEVLTLYTYTDDEKDIRTIVDLSYADSHVQLETFTDEEINEHLLEIYEEYVYGEGEREMKTKLKEIKDWIERQKETISDIQRFGFSEVIGGNEDYQDWLEEELSIIFNMVEEL